MEPKETKPEGKEESTKVHGLDERVQEVEHIRKMTSLRHRFVDEVPPTVTFPKTIFDDSSASEDKDLLNRDSEDEATRMERKILLEKVQSENKCRDQNKDLIQELTEEVMEYTSALNRYNKIPFKEDGREVYLINIDWMNLWRKYTCYDQISKGEDPEPEDLNHFNKYRPPFINNETLLIKNHTRYFTPDQGNYLNNIIPPYYGVGKDFEIVDKEIWKMFEAKYKGIPIKRFHRGDRCTNTEIDLYIHSFDAVIFPPLKTLKESMVTLESKKLYISKHDTVLKMKERIAEIGQFIYNIDYTKDLDKIRVWKYTTEHFKTDDDFIKWVNKELYISEYKPISFEDKGQIMDMYSEYKIMDVLCLQNAKLAIDFIDKDDQGIFRTQKFEDNFIISKGECNNCLREIIITCQCECKKRQYCSNQCKINDMKFHSVKCILNLQKCASSRWSQIIHKSTEEIKEEQKNISGFIDAIDQKDKLAKLKLKYDVIKESSQGQSNERHSGLKDVEDTSNLNSVFHLFVNLLPNLTKQEISLTKDALCVHLNNLINQMWVGSEEHCVAWDLIKLFKLHYITEDCSNHPENIIKFILHKLHLELTKSDPEDELLDSISWLINPKLEESLNKDSIISTLFRMTEKGEYSSKVKSQASFYISLDIPNYSMIFNQLTKEGTNGRLILKFMDLTTNQNEYWYEEFTYKNGLDTIFEIVAKYTDRKLGTAISREYGHIQFDFTPIKIFLMHQNGDKLTREDSEVYPDSETTINEYVANILDDESYQDHDGILYLNGFCTKAEGYSFEIAIKTSNLPIPIDESSELEAQTANPEIDKLSCNEEVKSEIAPLTEPIPMIVADDSQIDPQKPLSMTFDELLTYHGRKIFYAKSGSIESKSKTIDSLSPYRIIFINRRIKINYAYKLNKVRIISSESDPSKPSKSILKKSHPLFGEFVGCLFIKNYALDQYEFLVYNNKRGQYVQYSGTKLISYEYFKEIPQEVFSNAIVLIYKDPKMTYGEIRGL
ncbi:unnamed protein product [Moneuplotes crassus]|uniref:DUSP domain-containing protein n=1 Tax=Euplotes crassus TaxID=5936 RepID=A0AAD1XMM6_EUPCR|nr:unnamed protein product [Moneuplotes crassus]